ncbi:MAG: DUF2283 domain-containing protein [Candidatus Njordarchaeales archaeon]
MNLDREDIIWYDPEADILVIKIADGKIHDEILLDNDIVLQLDENKNIIGIEIWDVSKRGSLKLWKN